MRIRQNQSGSKDESHKESNGKDKEVNQNQNPASEPERTGSPPQKDKLFEEARKEAVRQVVREAIKVAVKHGKSTLTNAMPDGFDEKTVESIVDWGKETLDIIMSFFGFN